MTTPFLSGDCRFLDYGSTVEIGKNSEDKSHWYFELSDNRHYFNLYPLDEDTLNEFAWQLQAILDGHSVQPLMESGAISALICIDGTSEPYMLHYIADQGTTSMHHVQVTDVDLKKIIDLIHSAPFNKEGKQLS